MDPEYLDGKKVETKLAKITKVYGSFSNALQKVLQIWNQFQIWNGGTLDTSSSRKQKYAVVPLRIFMSNQPDVRL